MAACKLVTIKNKYPLFKNHEVASSIELIELEEVGNTIVSGKNLFKKGDIALFIAPDYNIPNNELFSEYYAPNGDLSKNKLGANGRVRAIKFNWGKIDGIPVYSYGLLLPIDEVIKFTNLTLSKLRMVESDDLDEILHIRKLDLAKNGQLLKSNPYNNLMEFPNNMYKTDETNIHYLWDNIQYPIKLIGTEKVDGSSITLYSQNCQIGQSVGICSRRWEIPLYINKIVGKKVVSCINKVNIFLKKLFTKKDIDLNIYEYVPNDDKFIVFGKPYLDKLQEYSHTTGKNIALRGEITGSGFRGSGNSLNPHAKEAPSIYFYGMDELGDDNIWRKVNNSTLQFTLGVLGFKSCRVLFNRTFRSKLEIIKHCEAIIQREKDKGVNIEGIVLKTENNYFSAKYMNLYYDSKK